MFQILVILILAVFCYSQDSFEDFKKQQDKALKEENNKFKVARAEMDKEFRNFVDDIEKKYKTFVYNDEKRIVTYSKNKTIRNIIDFEKKTYKIEFVSKEKPSVKLIDSIKQEIKNLEEKKNPFSGDAVIAENVNISKININDAKKESTNDEGNTLYKIEVPFLNSSQLNNEVLISEYVQTQCNLYDVPFDLVMAMIKKSSNFNTFAEANTYYINEKIKDDQAYGMMQIVPNLGGKEAYQFLTKTAAAPTLEYLKDPKNNIQLGIIYLHLLKTNTFKDVKNPSNQIYAMIATYVNGKQKLSELLKAKNESDLLSKINALDPDKMFEILDKLNKNKEDKVSSITKEQKNYKVDETEKKEIIKTSNELISNKELSKAVNEWIGVPYLWGGETKKGVDCSAFVRSVYKDVFNVVIPRTAYDQYVLNNAKQINAPDLKEGDLVYFKTINNGKPISHVGIYLGQTKFAHASCSKGVMIDSLKKDYYREKYVDANRPEKTL